jgi:hypothetical protein
MSPTSSVDGRTVTELPGGTTAGPANALVNAERTLKTRFPITLVNDDDGGAASGVAMFAVVDCTEVLNGDEMAGPAGVAMAAGVVIAAGCLPCGAVDSPLGSWTCRLAGGFFFANAVVSTDVGEGDGFGSFRGEVRGGVDSAAPDSARDESACGRN